MDITIPAIASPRPDSRPSLVLTNATIPAITLSGTRLTNPSRNAAIAHLLTGRPASAGPASSGSVGSGEVIVKATVAPAWRGQAAIGTATAAAQRSSTGSATSRWAPSGAAIGMPSAAANVATRSVSRPGA